MPGKSGIYCKNEVMIINWTIILQQNLAQSHVAPIKQMSSSDICSKLKSYSLWNHSRKNDLKTSEWGFSDTREDFFDWTMLSHTKCFNVRMYLLLLDLQEYEEKGQPISVWFSWLISWNHFVLDYLQALRYPLAICLQSISIKTGHGIVCTRILYKFWSPPTRNGSWSQNNNSCNLAWEMRCSTVECVCCFRLSQNTFGWNIW